MARLTRTRVLCALMTGFVLGCSDSGEEGSLSRQEFAAAASIAECADLGDCCAIDGHPYDEPGCVARTTSILEARLANQAVRFDGAAASRCVRALRASPGQCAVTEDELDACSAVFRGTKPAGAECVDPWECADFPSNGYCSLPFPDGDPQVCVTIPPPPQRASVGEACDGTCRHDDRGTSCTFAGSSGEPAAVCFTEDGVFCDVTTARCAPLLPPGGACDRLRSSGCPSGTFCDGARCVPALGEGASCLIDFCEDFSCPSPGAEACASPLVCTVSSADPRCIAPQPDGSPCASFAECRSSWCELDCADGSCSGVCEPPKTTSPEWCAGTLDEAAESAAVAAPTTSRGGRRALPWDDASFRR